MNHATLGSTSSGNSKDESIVSEGRRKSLQNALSNTPIQHNVLITKDNSNVRILSGKNGCRRDESRPSHKQSHEQSCGEQPEMLSSATDSDGRTVKDTSCFTVVRTLLQN